MLVQIIALSAAAAQAQPDTSYFNAAEIRTMCRGETEESPQFRTEAAFRLLAQVQRSKCRMYLLGLADGIGRGQPDQGRAACLPPASEREALADRLVEAVLNETGDADTPAIVRWVLRTVYGCS